MSIKHIIHIADLHIGSGSSRSAEYRKVFDNLAIEITKINETPLIIIAGDVFHHKTRYSGEDVADFNYLLDILKQYTVIIIPGNHDANLYDTQRTDLLTPIIENKPNVLYYKQSGIYTLANLTFYHVSVFGTETAADVEALIGTTLTQDTILLYHGMISGAKVGTHTATEQRITAKVLNSVRMTIAGDIHQHQFITPTCAYSGSLIQQNVAESITKGFLHWDLERNVTTFVPVANTCGFIRLDLRGKTSAEVTDAIAALPQLNTIHKVRLLTDATNADYNDQVKKITDCVGRVDSIAQTLPELNIINPSEDLREALCELLTKHNATPDQIEEIVTSHCGKVKAVNATKWSVLELHWGNMFKYGNNNSIDFTQLNDISGVIANNMAGKSSIIDILVFGLFGEHLRADNKSMIRNGASNSYVRVKFSVSSDIYIIDRIDDNKKHTKLRLYKIDQNIHINITEQSTDATYRTVKSLIGSLETFQTTGLYYDPNLDIVKMKNNARMMILPELFGMTDNESILAEVKSKLKDAKAQLDKLVKPREDLQPHALRENLIVQLSNINTQFDHMKVKQAKYTAAIESSRDYLRKVRNPDIVMRGLVKLEAESKELHEILDSMGNIVPAPFAQSCATPCLKITKIAALQYTGTEEELSARISQLGPAPQVPSDLDKQITETKSTIEQLTSELDSMQDTEFQDVDILNKQLSEINAQISSHKMLSIDAKHINTLTQQRDKLASSTLLTFDTTCACCEKNKLHLASDLAAVEQQLSAATIQLNENIAKNNITTAQLIKLREQRQDIQNNINISVASYKSRARKSEISQLLLTTNANLTKYIELSLSAANYKQATADLPALVKKRSQIQQINTARKQVDSYNAYLAYEQWLTYSNLKARIAAIDNDITAHKEELDTSTDYISTIADINNKTIKLTKVSNDLTATLIEIGKLNNRLEVANNEIAIYAEYYLRQPPLHAEVEKYKKYAECLGSAGLRMAIIKRNINKLIDATNNILTLVCNFKLAYELSDKGIAFTIVEPNNCPPLSLGSGFQKFIISVAMRLALTSILPSSCQFIIIDEGFGCMDSQNIEQVGKLFAHISGKFKFTFIISHREQLQPIITQPLFINETAQGSFVTPHENLIVTCVVKALEDKEEQLIEIPADSYKCECGIVVKKTSRSAHIKTARHIKKITMI